MSKTIEAPSGTDGKKGKKGLIIIILIAIIAIGGGAGGTWYYLKMTGDGEEPAKPKPKPTTFVDLELFTVNLDDNGQYLQVGLTVKTRETPVVAEMKKQMPEIRNRILMLLSSKKVAQISGIVGKQQLSKEIVDEIKQSLTLVELQEDVLEVLFTSFVIQ